MESTGVYWKPVYAVLEGAELEIIVANEYMLANPGSLRNVLADKPPIHIYENFWSFQNNSGLTSRTRLSSIAKA